MISVLWRVILKDDLCQVLGLLLTKRRCARSTAIITRDFKTKVLVPKQQNTNKGLGVISDLPKGKKVKKGKELIIKHVTSIGIGRCTQCYMQQAQESGCSSS